MPERVHTSLTIACAAVCYGLLQILTWGQLLEASVNYVGRASGLVDWKAWTPNFTESVQHFAIHAGMNICSLTPLLPHTFFLGSTALALLCLHLRCC
jgi:hypothetical protein